MRNVRTRANSVDHPSPNLCLRETMVNTDKNQTQKQTNLSHVLSQSAKSALVKTHGIR